MSRSGDIRPRVETHSGWRLSSGLKALIAFTIAALPVALYFNGTLKSIPGVNLLRTELRDTTYRNNGIDWNAVLLDRGDFAGRAQANFLLLDEYDKARQRGTLRYSDEASYHQRFAALSEQSFKDLYKNALDKKTNELKTRIDEASENNDDLKPLRYPAAAAAAAVAIYNGKTLKYSLGGGYKVSTRSSFTNGAYQGQYMGLDTPFVGTGFESGTNGNRAAIYREFAALRLRTEVTYADRQQEQSVGVTKAIDDHWSVNYRQSQNNKGQSDTVGVGYSTGF